MKCGGSLEQGFAIVDGVFGHEEIAVVSAAIARSTIARTKGGARHVLATPAVREIASDSRLTQIASSWLRAQAFPFRATLFDKSLSANWLVAWHQDTALPIAGRTENAEWGPWTTKSGVLHAIAPARALGRMIALRVHLDDSTPTNGPLRVLPATHDRGILDHETIQRLSGSIAPVECTTNAGGVVAMRPLVLHASSKATDDRPRRVLHIEYAADVHLDRDVELAIG